MTERMNDNGSRSRRTFLKGTLAGGLALGAGANSALAQDDQADTKKYVALIFAGSFHPGAKFVVTSDVLNYTPVVPQGAETFGDHNSRVIKYLNTNERVLFFPANDAKVQKGAVYELSKSIQPITTGAQPVWQVTFSPVDAAVATTTKAGNETTTVNETTTEGGSS